MSGHLTDHGARHPNCGLLRIVFLMVEGALLSAQGSRRQGCDYLISDVSQRSKSRRRGHRRTAALCEAQIYPL